MADDVATDQAPEQSVLDKLAQRFGDVPKQAPEQQEAEAPQFEEIDWEGVKYNVPPKIKEGLMRNKDYTQKTQELAEQRKAYEHATEVGRSSQLERAFYESIATEQQELAVIDAYLAQMAKADWGSLSMEQMLKQKMEVDNIKERKAAIKESIADKRGKFDTEMKTRLSELRGKARELASKSINGFSEETEKSMRQYAASRGLTDSEIDNVLLDPRSFRVIHDAMQFDKVQSAAKEPVAPKAGVLKPGAASEKMPPEVVAKLNFNKAIAKAKTSGEKAKLIEERLQGIFR